MNDSKPSNPSGGGYATNSAVDVCQIVKTMFIISHDWKRAD